MAVVWITYEWADNEFRDVDFIAQELRRVGLQVKLKQWHLGGNQPLWDQVEPFVSEARRSNCWILIATRSGLQRTVRKEEVSYAIARAHETRGTAYPVITLFLTETDLSVVCAGGRDELEVSVTDPDWKRCIAAAAEGSSGPASEEVPPFFLTIHQPPMRRQPIAIEVRPREGVWQPFCAAIPFKERRRVQPSIMVGPSHAPTASGNLSGFRAGPSRDRSLWLLNAANPGTPTESYYIWCDELPTELIFGVDGDVPQYAVSFTAESIRESGRKRCSSGAKELDQGP